MKSIDVLLTILIVVLLGVMVLAIVYPDTNRQHWDEAVSNGYVFYVDGIEVDPNNLDKSFYSKVHFDDENKKVMVSVRN